MYTITTAIQHYDEHIMRESLEDWEDGISIGEKNFSNM